LRGTVVDGATGAHLANALVAVEVGGLYVPNADVSRGNPSYRLAATTGADGTFDLAAPGGDAGVHAFINGYYYGSQKVTVNGATTFMVNAEPGAPAAARPALTAFTVDPPTAAPGGSVTVRVTATAASDKHPLSEEVLLISSAEGWSAAMDPPSPGVQGKGYPNGDYHHAFTAPKQPGTYTYVVTATTETCVSSDPVTVTLEVH